jgi:hypothetical protein
VDNTIEILSQSGQGKEEYDEQAHDASIAAIGWALLATGCEVCARDTRLGIISIELSETARIIP